MRTKIIKIAVKEAIEYADEKCEDIFSVEWLETYEKKVKELETKYTRQNGKEL